jgi:hypothetical protein
MSLKVFDRLKRDLGDTFGHVEYWVWPSLLAALFFFLMIIDAHHRTASPYLLELQRTMDCLTKTKVPC